MKGTKLLAVPAFIAATVMMSAMASSRGLRGQTSQHLVQGLDQLVLGLGNRAVVAVAVGRFDHQNIGLGDAHAIAHQQR